MRGEVVTFLKLVEIIFCRHRMHVVCRNAAALSHTQDKHVGLCYDLLRNYDKAELYGLRYSKFLYEMLDLKLREPLLHRIH